MIKAQKYCKQAVQMYLCHSDRRQPARRPGNVQASPPQRRLIMFIAGLMSGKCQVFRFLKARPSGAPGMNGRAKRMRNFLCSSQSALPSPRAFIVKPEYLCGFGHVFALVSQVLRSRNSLWLNLLPYWMVASLFVTTWWLP